MKNYNEFLLFVIIITLLLGDMLLLGHILSELYNWDTTIIAGSIGFIGALLGGAITFIGVKYTLSYQEKRDILNSYPERRKLGDDINMDVSETYRVLKHSITNERYGFLSGYVNEKFRDRDDVLSKASKVSDSLYETLRSNFYVDLRSLDFLLNSKEVNINELNSFVDNFYMHAINISTLVEDVTKEYRKTKSK